MKTDLVRKFLNRIAPIVVRAHWADCATVHRCWSRKEALEWMACYPVDAYIFVYNRFGPPVAMRRETFPHWCNLQLIRAKAKRRV